MAAVFELVFDLFNRVIQVRIKVYFVKFQKVELKALFSELGRTKCKCLPFFAWILESFSRQVQSPIWLSCQTFCLSYTLFPLSKGAKPSQKDKIQLYVTPGNISPSLFKSYTFSSFTHRNSQFDFPYKLSYYAWVTCNFTTHTISHKRSYSQRLVFNPIPLSLNDSHNAPTNDK